MKIMVFAGPSGGHLFPALAFAQVMRRRVPASRLILVTSQKAGVMTSTALFQIFDNVYFLPNFPYLGGISLRTLEFLLQLFRAFVISNHYLSNQKPDLCIGFGSYASFPGMALAALRKIPTLIHEQNQVPGKATLWLVPWVRAVAVSFEATLADRSIKRREVTGLPVRQELRPAGPDKTAIGIKDAAKPMKILVVGGSQGAHSLNQLILQTFSHFPAGEKSEIAVTHITGPGDYEWVTDEYQKMKINYRTYPFFEKMNELYDEADLAITRAGANTLFELALFAIPSIVIPYPYAGAHQEENARYFSGRGAILFKTQDELTRNPAWLGEQIQTLKNNTEMRKKFSEAIRKLAAPEAGEKLAALAEKLL
ncbi:MAG: UDP-N-acetylglucosamine--N-acetylmuramyl-(pentapeptide) pyrophosphoryl-undecaprenol N-acetylglucosamine transferase [Candidatus Omnitrophica bacterium]|nr:UDP-N-acetylglucosamine--N-acetylmuramyl-(pentapeptide) pyrophosphoryl-undecaprenol N-acetylglucosamine transferase [Candidatus Omnitrophota bacterium]